MKRYVIRRLLMAIPLLLAISFVCFCFINLIPFNPAEVALRVQQTPVITDEIIAAMEEQLGLNKPFFVRYFDWVLGCLHGDFGISYVNPKRTVAGELLRCLPATLQLAGTSFVIVAVLSIPIGFLCAVYKDGWFDKIMRGLVFVTTAISSLDAHTQVQVMDLLRELKDRLGLTYIFITHDLTSITYLCDDVLSLYQGRVTENLPVARISETKDEYARKLLESIVVFDTEESA